ncbi:MAG: putative cysteine desulfurase, partial [Chloroflexota bacterium]
MNAMIAEHPAALEAPPQHNPTEAEREQAFAELCEAVGVALKTYANVHRGSGHHSTVTTYLYEQARALVLAHVGRSSATNTVIFCTPRRVALLERQLDPRHVTTLSSQDMGLPLGLRALVVRRRALPQGAPFEPGGGTARLVGPNWVVWAAAPDRFEAGTPPIINVIAFARALELTRRFGSRVFAGQVGTPCSAADILAHDELAHLTGYELLDALNQTLVGRDVLVPTTDGPRPFINLDNAASTPTFAPVWDVVQQAWGQPRLVQAEIVREVRSICAAALGAPPAGYQLIFTANTTEAINLVAASLGHEVASGSEPVVLNTLLEHNSNELPWRSIPGVRLVRLAIDDEGFVSLAELEAVLQAYNQRSEHGRQRIALVAVSGASNVLGVVNDLAAISAIVHRYGARLLVDAAQLVAHRKVEVERWGIDYLACSAHKLYAPFGSGLLVARAGLLRFSP